VVYDLKSCGFSLKIVVDTKTCAFPDICDGPELTSLTAWSNREIKTPKPLDGSRTKGPCRNIPNAALLLSLKRLLGESGEFTHRSLPWIRRRTGGSVLL